MAYVSALPERYIPLRSLELCSNTFVGVSMPIAVQDFPILLIGSGVVPVVWLAAPRSPGAKEWGYVVADGRSVNPAIQVRVDPKKRETVVFAGSTKVIRAVMTGDDSARVLELDLRPVGLNVTGSASGLNIAANKFARNRIEGARVGIALG